MIGPLILIAAFAVLLYRGKMKRGARNWLVLVFSLSVVAVVTAGISWDSYIKKVPVNPVVDCICMGTALIATLSILPSFICMLVLGAKRGWEESIGMAVALLLGTLAFLICDSSWPILRT